MGLREQKLKELGYADIETPQPPGTLVWMDMVVIDGTTAYVSGHTSGDVRGKVPSKVDLATAKKAAEWSMANLLRTLRGHIGSLDRVERVLRLTGYVNTDLDFTDPSLVIHGASELLYTVFGDAGKHARTALGLAQLPGGTTVEVEAIFKLKK